MNPFSKTEKGFGVGQVQRLEAANLQESHPLFHESDIAPLFHPHLALSLKEATLYPELIFVTNITNYICGEKSVTLRNFRFL